MARLTLLGEYGVDMSLQVDPAVLRQGAAVLHTHRVLLDDLLAGIRFEHSKLREVWNGRAADHVAAVWEELAPRVTAHIAELTSLASGLATAADSFATQDETRASRITSAECSLDLP